MIMSGQTRRTAWIPNQVSDDNLNMATNLMSGPLSKAVKIFRGMREQQKNQVYFPN